MENLMLSLSDTILYASNAFQLGCLAIAVVIIAICKLSDLADR